MSKHIGLHFRSSKRSRTDDPQVNKGSTQSANKAVKQSVNSKPGKQSASKPSKSIKRKKYQKPKSDQGSIRRFISTNKPTTDNSDSKDAATPIVIPSCDNDTIGNEPIQASLMQDNNIIDQPFMQDNSNINNNSQPSTVTDAKSTSDTSDNVSDSKNNEQLASANNNNGNESLIQDNNINASMHCTCSGVHQSHIAHLRLLRLLIDTAYECAKFDNRNMITGRDILLARRIIGEKCLNTS